MPKAVRKPSTPRRLSAFLDALLPAARRMAPILPSSQPASPNEPGRTAGHCAVALQNEDNSNDAIVITTLPAAPFCCHEDLVEMDRGQLERVARRLNARLPAALQIDLGKGKSDAFVRNSIELAVGIRTRLSAPSASSTFGSSSIPSTSGVRTHDENAPRPANAGKEKPGKPPHMRSKSFDVRTILSAPRAPATPPRRAHTHKRTRSSSAGLSFGLYNAAPTQGGSAQLEVLEEESDEDDSLSHEEPEHARRPVKKRRTADDAKGRRRVEGDREEDKVATTPTPGPRHALHRRTPSYHGRPIYGLAPAPAPIYRPVLKGGLRRSASAGGPSLELAERVCIDLGETGNTRYRPKARLGQTSTPKRSALATFVSAPSDSAALASSFPGSRRSRLGDTLPSSPWAMLDVRDVNRDEDVAMTGAGGSPARSMKRKAEAATPDDAELTFGIDGMTISLTLSQSSEMAELAVS